MHRSADVAVVGGGHLATYVVPYAEVTEPEAAAAPLDQMLPVTRLLIDPRHGARRPDRRRGAVTSTPPDYSLGAGDAERLRLVAQCEIHRPGAEQLVDRSASALPTGSTFYAFFQTWGRRP